MVRYGHPADPGAPARDTRGPCIGAARIYDARMSTVPDSLRWLFWDVDVDLVDLEEHAATVLGRVLENGRLCDVRLVLEIYGTRRILEFFRDGGHSLLSERTRSFWTAFFGVDETWPTRPDFRSPSVAPWID
jgi:hypothetical protein